MNTAQKNRQNITVMFTLFSGGCTVISMIFVKSIANLSLSQEYYLIFPLLSMLFSWHFLNHWYQCICSDKAKYPFISLSIAILGVGFCYFDKSTLLPRGAMLILLGCCYSFATSFLHSHFAEISASHSTHPTMSLRSRFVLTGPTLFCGVIPAFFGASVVLVSSIGWYGLIGYIPLVIYIVFWIKSLNTMDTPFLWTNIILSTILQIAFTFFYLGYSTAIESEHWIADQKYALNIRSWAFVIAYPIILILPCLIELAMTMRRDGTGSGLSSKKLEQNHKVYADQMKIISFMDAFATALAHFAWIWTPLSYRYIIAYAVFSALIIVRCRWHYEDRETDPFHSRLSSCICITIIPIIYLVLEFFKVFPTKAWSGSISVVATYVFGSLTLVCDILTCFHEIFPKMDFQKISKRIKKMRLLSFHTVSLATMLAVLIAFCLLGITTERIKTLILVISAEMLLEVISYLIITNKKDFLLEQAIVPAKKKH